MYNPPAVNEYISFEYPTILEPVPELESFEGFQWNPVRDTGPDQGKDYDFHLACAAAFLGVDTFSFPPLWG